jgi:hypothetical protein
MKPFAHPPQTASTMPSVSTHALFVSPQVKSEQASTPAHSGPSVSGLHSSRMPLHDHARQVPHGLLTTPGSVPQPPHALRAARPVSPWQATRSTPSQFSRPLPHVPHAASAPSAPAAKVRPSFDA